MNGGVGGEVRGWMAEKAFKRAQQQLKETKMNQSALARGVSTKFC